MNKKNGGYEEKRRTEKETKMKKVKSEIRGKKKKRNERKSG